MALQFWTKSTSLGRMVPFVPLMTFLVFQGCGKGFFADSGDGLSSASDGLLLNLGDFTPASLAIGQIHFGAPDAGPTQNIIQNPGGVGLSSTNGKLYITDPDSNRVLGFNSLPSSSGTNADFVIGQAGDFTTSTSGANANQFSAPGGLHLTSSQMLVADTNNNRILIFNSLPTSDAASADVAVGQTAFGGGNTSNGCTATTLNHPANVFVVGTKLLVADTANNRVLIYNSIPTSSGASANLVLGQMNFTTCASNSPAASVNAAGLSAPQSVWSNGTQLAVADTGNNRILIWNSFPTTSGQAADVVLGQPTMADSTANNDTGGISARSLQGPINVTGLGTQFFVADSGNLRILIWSAMPISNYSVADIILGQASFTESINNAAATSTGSTFAMYADSKRLIVGDQTNKRFLVFKSQ